MDLSSEPSQFVVERLREEGRLELIEILESVGRIIYVLENVVTMSTTATRKKMPRPGCVNRYSIVIML